MSLFDGSWPSTNANPPDTEAFRLGAQRIRETRDAVEAFLAKIFNDDSTFKTNVIPGTALQDASVTHTQIGDNEVQLSKLPAGVFTSDATGRGKFANGFTNAVLLEEAARGDCHQIAAATLSVGVYAVTLTPAPTVYTDGMVVRFVTGLGGGNTGPSSLNVNALGAKPINRADGSALSSGDIALNTVITVVYSATLSAFVMSYAPLRTFQTIGYTATANSTIADVPHGLPGWPSSVRWTLRNVTGELGYSPGEEVVIDGSVIENGSTNAAFVSGASSTNIFLLETEIPRIRRKDTRVYAQITAGKWVIEGVARL